MPMLIVVLALGDLAFPEYFAGFEAVTILGAFGVIFAFGIAFWYSRKHLQKISVEISNIRLVSNRIQAIAKFLLAILSVTVSLGQMEKTYSSLLSVCGGVLITVLSFGFYFMSNNCHFLLVIMGYKFYKFNLPVGVSDCILITRKEIRNQKEICSVRHFCGYLYIDGDD